jgi:hypothetical protein
LLARSHAARPDDAPTFPQILVEQQLASIAMRQGLLEGVLSDPDKASSVPTRVAEIPLPDELRSYFNSPPGMSEVRLIQEKSGSNITLEPGSADPTSLVARLTGTEYQVKMGSELLQRLLVRVIVVFVRAWIDVYHPLPCRCTRSR